jgi:uncharacterized protein YdiU (UPF0061 family)
VTGGPTISTEFAFDNTYADQMEGFYAPARAAQFAAPKLLALNEALAQELRLDPERLRQDAHLIFSGQVLPDGANPIAQAYAGHQFGGFSPQLGDGRAMMIGEVVDAHGVRRDIQLKGSGPTVFSRGGDGKASVGPVLREYLISEAMAALGVPTTRMLAAVATGTPVYRPQILPGAVVTRVASSHIRVGTFEYFAARGDVERTRRLADYAIARHYPELESAPDKYLGLLKAVGEAQAELIARWMLVGFVHGVMNTDNFTVSGETIDYGPCAFMDTFSPNTVFSSIDHAGRYAYGNQPRMGQWNLARFADTLLPLFADEQEAAIEQAQGALHAFADRYEASWLSGMRDKLGLTTEREEDAGLIGELVTLLQDQSLDYTMTLRGLSAVARGDEETFTSRLSDPETFESWQGRWFARLDAQDEGRERAAELMDTRNPVYIPRNHKVEEALTAAVEEDNLEPFQRLLEVVTRPFSREDRHQEYAEPAPEPFTACYRTFCGT